MLAALPVALSPSLPPSNRMPSRKAVACLSLGPYGAQLQPGQEYAGRYPPPFGPHQSTSELGYSNEASEACGPLPLDEFSLGGIPEDEGEQEQERALAAWHLQRLRHFAYPSGQDGADKATGWRGLGMIAFETLPLLREARAARRAMASLAQSQSRDGGQDIKPFYLSFVFPLAPVTVGEGEKQQDKPACPDPSPAMTLLRERGDLDAQARAIISACFDDRKDNGSAKAKAMEMARPAGVGVNCSSPSRLGEIVNSLSEALASREAENGTGEQNDRPWLILCELSLAGTEHSFDAVTND